MNTQGIWRFKDVNFSKDRGSVFSCFACCGGSTMGYKLAGFDVVGCNEIDPKVFKIYNLNHKPRFPFVMSIRDMLKQKTLPQELYNLDILDGSPPCTSFSTAGVRERDWGKEKRFSEGQALQRLDDLFFEFIALAQRLQPKIVVAENVAGMVKGKARGYIKEIVQAYDQAGYTTQLFRLNGANMGICQTRDRVFFISVRKDLNFLKINLQFNEKPIAFLQVEKWISGVADEYGKCTDNELQMWKKCKEGKFFSSVHPKGSYFTYKKVHRNKPISTIVSQSQQYHYKHPRPLSTNELLACSSFPLDYNWGSWVASKKRWAMGMSVPPFMIERIANEIYKQWLSVL
tara:strand:+ start:370 stop:1401 length:1032 start_codon:yes stop_codon:yes gene_type:complete